MNKRELIWAAGLIHASFQHSTDLCWTQVDQERRLLTGEAEHRDGEWVIKPQACGVCSKPAGHSGACRIVQIPERPTLSHVPEPDHNSWIKPRVIKKK